MDTTAEVGISSVKGESECFLVINGQVDYYWDMVKPMLEKSVAKSQGELTTEDIRQFILRGMMQLFVVLEDGKCVFVGATELVQYPQMKVARVVSIAGSFKKWRRFNDHFEIWAAANGALYVEASAPPNVARWHAIEKTGLEPVYMVMRKRIERSVQ